MKKQKQFAVAMVAIMLLSVLMVPTVMSGDENATLGDENVTDITNVNETNETVIEGTVDKEPTSGPGDENVTDITDAAYSRAEDADGNEAHTSVRMENDSLSTAQEAEADGSAIASQETEMDAEHGHADSPEATLDDNDKEQAIEAGLAWLADKQDPDTGAWNLGYYPVGSTAFAVLKFEHHAKYILGIDPFDDDYIYKDNIVNGLNYLFNHSYYIDIDNQTVPAPRNDDPDGDGDGKGIFFVSDTPDRRSPYETGIMMMTLEASCSKTRKVQYGEHAGLTYLEVMQDMVDYISWAQQDSGWGRGGWRYCAWDDGVGVRVPNTGLTHPGADNSVSQWPVLGLMSAANWGINAPDWVKTYLLDDWLKYSQNGTTGCFGYDSSAGGSVDMTAAGLIELTYCGVTTADPRWKAGRQCICEKWDISNKGNFYAMYGVMKAAMTADDDLIKKGLQPVKTFCGHDWQEEYDEWLIDKQIDGYWTAHWGKPGEPNTYRVLGTEWALLILQKVVPPLPYRPLQSFEDLLKSQEELLFSFENLLNRTWDELSTAEQLEFLESFEDLLKSQEDLLKSFEELLIMRWDELSREDRISFLRSFEDLLKSQEKLLFSFEDLLKRLYAVPVVTSSEDNNPYDPKESFEDLLKSQEKLLFRFEELKRTEEEISEVWPTSLIDETELSYNGKGITSK